MAAVLRREGWPVNRKRAKRLMRVMGLGAIYPKPNTSLSHPDHRVYPYLLRGLVIDRPNQIWCADITYVPMAKGFVYLVAVGAADAFRHIDPRPPVGGGSALCGRSAVRWTGSAGGCCPGGYRSPWKPTSVSRR